jgi:transposase
MLSLALPVEIYFCTETTDMRRGFDGLMRMAEEHLSRDVLSGGLYVFVNRRRDRLKLLYWDNDGLAIWHKRLSSGRFRWWPKSAGAAAQALAAHRNLAE